MSPKRPRKPRPYWHKDAKWLFGLPLVLLASLTLLFYGLSLVTDEEPAVDTLSMAMALALSRNGIDDETEVNEFLAKVAPNADGAFQPIPGLRVTVRKEDVEGMSPRQMRLSLFRQLAAPIYRNGALGLAELADDPILRRSIEDGAGSLGILTAERHQWLQRASGILGAGSLILLVPLLLFSFRFGRLGNPGCVLFLAGLPGAVLFSVISRSPPPSSQPPPNEAGAPALAMYVLSHVLPPLAEIMSRNYLVVLAAGLGLMALATSASILWWLFRRLRPV